MSHDNLPPDFAALAQTLKSQPPEMRVLFYYALPTMLIGGRKASIVHQGVIDGCGTICLKLKGTT